MVATGPGALPAIQAAPWRLRRGADEIVAGDMDTEAGQRQLADALRTFKARHGI